MIIELDLESAAVSLDSNRECSTSHDVHDNADLRMLNFFSPPQVSREKPLREHRPQR
jgi:hypothetical protein